VKTKLGLRLEHVTKVWRGFALKDISLTVEDGEYFILLGPTGAGKTLLLETIMGFNKPDKGKIVLDSQDVTEVPPEKKKIGYAPQDSVLFPHMTVRQNIEFGLKMQGVEKTARTQTVNQLLDMTKLKAIEHHRPATLSGGEKQRVTLAQVLAINPKVILLDEPLASVDAETARELKKELKRIHAEHGKTVVHVTHNLIEGFNLGTKMAVMRAGEIVQVDEIRTIFAKPQNEFVARFLGYENVYKAQLIKSGSDYSIATVEGVHFKISGTMNKPEKTIAILPEDITVHVSPIKRHGANTFKGTIIEDADMGPFVMLTVDAGLILKAIVTKSSFMENAFEIGKAVWLHFKDNAVKILD
jgi:molybdate/tungstate transport system ATP-binding protein